MDDDILFCKYDLGKVIEATRQKLGAELDRMEDTRLLNTDPSALQNYAVDKCRIDLPELGEPVVDEMRTKMEVGAWGGFPRDGEPTVSVDTQQYTLEVRFEGDKELFFCRGSSFTMNPPR